MFFAGFEFVKLFIKTIPPLQKLIMEKFLERLVLQSVSCLKIKGVFNS